MAYRRWIAALVIGVVAGTLRSGDGGRKALRRSTCTPTVSGAPATVFDGNAATFWQTPGLIQQQIVTIDFGCTARVFRFRRNMTCDGTATSGQACNFLAQDGKRHLGGELVRFSPALGQPYLSSFDVGATGWETYRHGGGFDSLPYGWSPWLDLRGVTARTVQFYFVDLADALNEIEIEYEEGAGAVPGVTIVRLDLPLNGSPESITVGPDRALWFDERLAHRIGRLTTLGELNEFILPNGGTPSDILSGPDGALWFTEPPNHKIARMTTAGDVTEFSLSGGLGGLTDFTVGIDGKLWYTDWSSHRVGSLTTSGAFTEYATDPNRTGPNCIAVGSDGATWFGIASANRGPESIGRLDANGGITYFPTPAGPSKMVYGPDGAFWFTFGGQDDRIARMTVTGAISVFNAPVSTHPTAITIGPDANIWFGGVGVVGRITTSGAITTFPIPGSTSDDFVFDIVTGPEGALWFTIGGPNPGIGRLSFTQGPDLHVSLATQAETVVKSVQEEGGILSYTINVGNSGNQDASGVIVNQFVPLRSRFRLDLSSPGWQCAPDTEGGSFCSFPLGDLPHGQSRMITFEVEYIGSTVVAGSSLYTRSTVSDDRSHGFDLYQGDNSASITVPVGGECQTSDGFLGCCVVGMIQCFFDSTQCGGGPVSPHTTIDRMAKVGKAIGGALAAVRETARSLVLYYRVRDEVFARTPGGRRLTDLYYRHDSELKSLIRSDAALRSAAWSTLNAWAPTLQAIVDGNAGDPVSQRQVDQMLGFLNALAAKASPELQSAIASERQSLGLASLAGATPSAALQRIDHLTCAATDTTLCLNGGRFRVESTWTDFAGHSGVGHAVPMTNDTGSFWFFSPANIELTTKALDGRGVNGHYWFFYGALSNVAYMITVTDTMTGAARTYSNPSGRFGSAGDAAAFPGGTSTTSTVPSPLERSPEAYRFSANACTANSTSLCLNGGRFRVEVAWRDFQGNTGAGHAVPLTADTGTFWFFDSANVELVVKALDGRAFNNRYWLFYGALSNVEYIVTVTDTVTGAVKTYTNPSGTFASVGDAAAFTP